MPALRVAISRTVVALPLLWCVACSGSSTPGGASDAGTSGTPVAGSTTATPSALSFASTSDAAPKSSTSGRPAVTTAHGGGTPTRTVTTSPAPYPTPTGGKEGSPSANQGTVLNSLPGSSSTSCVEVASHSTVRAHTIAAGDFVAARRAYRQGGSGSSTPTFQVIPEHSRSMREAVVTVDPLNGGGTRTVRSRAINTAGDVKYYSVDIPIAAPGNYRLTMRSGDDSGCFLTSFTK